MGPPFSQESAVGPSRRPAADVYGVAIHFERTRGACQLGTLPSRDGSRLTTVGPPAIDKHSTFILPRFSDMARPLSALVVFADVSHHHQAMHVTLA